MLNSHSTFVKCLLALSILVSLNLGQSCSKKEDPLPTNLSLNYSFETNDEGWQVGYTDYPSNLTLNDSLNLYEMSYGYTTLPASISPSQKGMHIKGANRSDDLFMYLKKKVNGLKANASYQLDFNIELASNAPLGAVGVGGSPGESVFFKVGASPVEPKSAKASDNHYHLNLDKGFQMTEGKDMVQIGNIGVANNTSQFTLITRTNLTKPFQATTNNSGELWLIVGTDSGFEGLTEIYYANVKVDLTQK
jgi:hypothetical protein